MRASVTILVCYIGCCSVAAAGNYAEHDVTGHWHRGGFGYFTQLFLFADHTYTARWSGDEFDPKTGDNTYGRAGGKWKLQGDLLSIMPTRQTKEIKGDLQFMKLARQHHKIVVVPTHRQPVATMFHLDPRMIFERDE